MPMISCIHCNYKILFTACMLAIQSNCNLFSYIHEDVVPVILWVYSRCCCVSNFSTCLIIKSLDNIHDFRGRGRQSIQGRLISQQEKISVVKIESYAPQPPPFLPLMHDLSDSRGIPNLKITYINCEISAVNHNTSLQQGQINLQFRRST